MAKLTKLSLVVTRTREGIETLYEIDNTSSKKLKSNCRDLRDLYGIIKFADSTNRVLYVTQFNKEGCLFHVIRFMGGGRTGDNLDACLFIPSDADISAAEQEEIIIQLTDFVKLSNLSEGYTKLKSTLQKEYTIKKVAYPTASNETFELEPIGYREYNNNIIGLLGGHLFQKCYYSCGLILFIDRMTSEITSSKVRNLNNNKLTDYCEVSFNIPSGVEITFDKQRVTNSTVLMQEQGKKIEIVYSKKNRNDIKDEIVLPNKSEYILSVKSNFTFNRTIRKDFFVILGEDGTNLTDDFEIKVNGKKSNGGWTIPENQLDNVHVSITYNKNTEEYNIDISQESNGVAFITALLKKKTYEIVMDEDEIVCMDGKPISLKIDAYTKPCKSPIPGYKINNAKASNNKDNRVYLCKINPPKQPTFSVKSILCMLLLGVIGSLVGWFITPSSTTGMEAIEEANDAPKEELTVKSQCNNLSAISDIDSLQQKYEENIQIIKNEKEIADQLLTNYFNYVCIKAKIEEKRIKLNRDELERINNKEFFNILNNYKFDDLENNYKAAINDSYCDSVKYLLQPKSNKLTGSFNKDNNDKIITLGNYINKVKAQ